MGSRASGFGESGILYLQHGLNSRRINRAPSLPQSRSGTTDQGSSRLISARMSQVPCRGKGAGGRGGGGAGGGRGGKRRREKKKNRRKKERGRRPPPPPPRKKKKK